jgi:hypothetical protein
MATNYDDGLENMRNLVAQYGDAIPPLNEDTTRLRLIDTLFMECLDWDRHRQVRTEDRVDTGIIDYTMSLNGPMLIVEAKKTGVSFTLPAERTVRQKRTLESLMSLDVGISSAISQCARYALDEGAPFAVVSNGHQIIAFCLNRGPGASWKRGHALVFSSLRDMLENFRHLWDALSVEAIRTFRLSETLSTTPVRARAAKRSDYIKNHNRAKGRNDFQADLQILGDLVFGGRIFEDRRLFHEHCYCAGGSLSQFSQASRSYLEDRYPDFFSATATTPKLEPAQTKKGLSSALANITNIKKPILLLGDVGVGKTTFLEHLVLVDWADKKNDLIVIRIDLGDKPSRAVDVPNMVTREIEQSLLANYGVDVTENRFLRAVYHAQLKRFERTPRGTIKHIDPKEYALAEAKYIESLAADFDNHWCAILGHLVKSRHKMIVLIFDNVDQRDPEVQKATFIQSQIAASKWDVYVMLTLRPETFVRSKTDGPISGYHPRAFTISPPRFDALLERRILTAIRMLRGELPIPNIGGHATAQIKSVLDYLEMLDYSFRNEPDLLSFCEHMSGGNMRLALDYIVSFMACGHVDSNKILDRWRSTGRYQVPLHEFVRGTMFADREYYSGDGAAVMNVLDTQSGDPGESLGLTALLAVLVDSKDAYVAIEDVHARLQGVGFRPEQVAWLVQRALVGRLVESNLKVQDTENTTHVRISPTGRYYYDSLLRTFVYIDAVSTDTPISDHERLALIGEAPTLPARIERARQFVAYLSSIAAERPALAKLARWDEVSAAIKTDIDVAEAAGMARLRQARSTFSG